MLNMQVLGTALKNSNRRGLLFNIGLKPGGERALNSLHRSGNYKMLKSSLYPFQY